MADVVVVDQIHVAPTGGASSRFSGFVAGLQDSVLQQDDTDSDTAAEFHIGRDKLSVAFGTHARFDVSTGQKLLKGAVIDKAVLQVRASAIDTDAFMVAIGAPARDGYWDVLDNSKPQISLGNEVGLFKILQTTFPTTVIGPASTSANVHPIGYRDPGGPGPGTVGIQTISQSFDSTVIFSIVDAHTVEIKLSRTTNADGTLRLRLLSCTEDDGTDDRPDATLSASSDDVDVRTLTTGGGVVAFTFSGGDIWGAPVGERRVILLEWYDRSKFGGGSLVAGTDYISAFVSLIPSDIKNGSLGTGFPAGTNTSVETGWGPGNYPSHLMFPWLYGQTNNFLPGTNRLEPNEDVFGTPYTSPVGPVVTIAAPLFSSVGTYYEFSGLESIVQAIVDDASFDQDATPNLLALGVNTTLAANGEERLGDDVRLLLSWHFTPPFVPATGLATVEDIDVDPVVSLSRIAATPSLYASSSRMGGAVAIERAGIEAVAESNRNRITPAVENDKTTIDDPAGD